MITTTFNSRNQIADESKRNKGYWKPQRKKVILGPDSGYTVKHLMVFWANHPLKLK